MTNPHIVTNRFEKELAKYCGSPYAIAVTSCTMAILLAAKLRIIHANFPRNREFYNVSIPKRTYVSVPQSLIHAGFNVQFRNEDWIGEYEINPLRIWDCARWMRAGMYRYGTLMCLSFHWTKHLSIGQGGAILLDDENDFKILQRLRFDGRRPGVAPIKDSFPYLGYHCYMSPRDAAEGLSRLALLPRYTDPLPNDNYPDLSKIRVFKKYAKRTVDYKP